ncbi:MAG: hypothetical protein ACREOU_16810 [Candidatus Eiseniibacteriota bacterium]
MREVVFSEATTCTLIVESGLNEQLRAGDWRLRWVAQGCQLRPNTLSASDSSIADVVHHINSEQPGDLLGNVLATELRSLGGIAPNRARYVFDLPAGAKGLIQAVALDPRDPDSYRTIKSPIATINGGLTDSLPPVVFRTGTAHHSTELVVTAAGVGLSRGASIQLVGLDDSWRLPLDVVVQSDTVLTARADVAAHVPDCLLSVTTIDGARSNVPVEADPPPPSMQPLGASCQETYHETIYPFPMIQPKDFAFVLGGWTPSGVWVHHLFYIRQNQETKAHHGGIDFTEKNIGHAKSNDLLNWPMSEVDTAAVKVRPGMFDSKHVWAPCVVKRGLTYHMFYTGVASNGDQAIGLATSTDLVTWTQQPNPIFTASDLGAWAAPRGASGTGAAQLRDPFVMPDPQNPGSWLMYFVTIPAVQTNAQVVGFVRSTGSFTSWANDAPLYATLHPYPGPGQFEADVESPTVFQYQGKWWLLYSVREIRPIWAISNPASPTDQNAANWTQAADTNDLIIDEFTGQPTDAYFYWHGAEFLQVNASQNITFLGGWNDQAVGISYIAVQPAASPYLFEEHCPVSTTDVAEGGDTSEPKLTVIGPVAGMVDMRLRVDLPAAMAVRIVLYDVRGRKMRTLVDKELPSGRSDFLWDGLGDAGARANSGVYFARLEAAGLRRFARGVLLH